jgi:glycosyltransferase involved in cell wall biosynthesis
MACRADLACDFLLIALAGEQLGKNQPRSTSLGYGNPLNPLAQLAAARAVRSLDPDVLICSLWKCAPAAILAKLLLPRMKLVAFFHSARRVHLLDRLAHGLLIRFADAVWADSDATLQSAGPGKQSRVISFVIDKISADTRDRQPSPHFVSWSRIHHDKGMDRAVELIALLVSRGIDARFDLWGPDQGPRGALERQAERLGIGQRVRFHGPISRSDLPAVADEAGFLLQLSRQEGMAMVVVEAMQLGLVPIVTPVGEMGRYCRDGENAVVVDVARLDLAADRIAATLNDPKRYSSLSNSARAKWSHCRLYSDDVCMAATELAGQT